MPAKSFKRFRLAACMGLAVLAQLAAAPAAQAADLGLVKPGTLTYCSSMDAPPLAEYDENQQPRGFSVDVARDVAKQLGNLKVDWKVMSFSGQIPALEARQCDLVIGQLYDKPERRQIIDLIDYMYSSESIMVPRDNPHHVHTLDDLSGLKVAVLNGTTMSTLLDKENEHLKAMGKKPMNIVVYSSDADAFQGFRAQQVDAYGTTAESGAHFQQASGNMFIQAVPPFGRIATGIGARKGEPLSPAVARAVAELVKSDRYGKMLAKWNIEGDRY